MKRIKILITDDQPHVRSFLRTCLLDQPWEVLLASHGRQAMTLLTTRDIDVAVLDLHMPGMGGLDVLQQIRKQKLSTDVVIMAAFGTIQMAVHALRSGARDFLMKPVMKGPFVEKMHALVQARLHSPDQLAEQMLTFVQTQASDPHLTLNKLQEQFRISKSYACKLFHDLGLSFSDVLIRSRMKKAKELMTRTDEPLYAIAELCGFKNAQRFSEAFHRHEGLPPSQFRKLQKEPIGGLVVLDAGPVMPVNRLDAQRRMA